MVLPLQSKLKDLNVRFEEQVTKHQQVGEQRISDYVTVTCFSLPPAFLFPPPSPSLRFSSLKLLDETDLLREQLADAHDTHSQLTNEVRGSCEVHFLSCDCHVTVVCRSQSGRRSMESVL